MFDSLVNYVMHIAPMVQSLGGWIYVILFAVAIIESTPVLGTFTPGTLMLVFFGFLISISGLHLVYCIFAATLGAVSGDYLGYLLGRYGRRFFKEHKGLLRISHLEMGQAFFNRHGGKSILIGRFIGVIRPVVPMVAGAVHMSMRRFLPLNFFSAFLWSSILISTGYFVGDKWQKAEGILTFIGVAGLFVICVLFARHILKMRLKNKTQKSAGIVSGIIDLS